MADHLKKQPEYLSSVTLLILADDLKPQLVSKCLELKPDKAWRKGDKLKIKTLEHVYRWGGWKKFIPKHLNKREIPQQLSYWVKLLSAKKDKVETLVGRDYYIALNCYIKPIGDDGGTASITLDPKLLKSFGEMGITLEWAFSS